MTEESIKRIINNHNYTVYRLATTADLGGHELLSVNVRKQVTLVNSESNSRYFSPSWVRRSLEENWGLNWVRRTSESRRAGHMSRHRREVLKSLWTITDRGRTRAVVLVVHHSTANKHAKCTRVLMRYTHYLKQLQSACLPAFCHCHSYWLMTVARERSL